MKIKGIANISSSNAEQFYNSLKEYIDNYQNDGQEVEVQYSTNVNECINGGIVYSALILGRK